MAGADLSPTVLGVDVGAKKLHGVTWDGQKVALLVSRHGGSDGMAEAWAQDTIRGWVAQHRPSLVAVDAPCRPGRHSEGKRRRLCETEAVHYVNALWQGARRTLAQGERARFDCAATPHERSAAFDPWMRVGFAVYALLESDGYRLAEHTESVVPGQRAVMEVYPDATFWLLAIADDSIVMPEDPGAPLPRKRHAPAAAVAGSRLRLLPPRLRGAVQQHASFPAHPTGRIDYLDAACAALTGHLALHGQARCVPGRPGEGAMWVPDRSGASGTGVPHPIPYTRTTDTDGDVHRASDIRSAIDPDVFATSAADLRRAATDLELAVRHLHTAATHASQRDVSLMSAHVLAAEGRVCLAQQELTALAIAHASQSAPD